MVEKWLKPKRIPMRPMRAKGNPYHYGTPIQLFKDSDKDGVPNVFDCQPKNKKRQDVMMPMNLGGGMRDMWARQESVRQQKAYQKQLEEFQRLEELKLAELQRLSNVQVIDNTRTIYDQAFMVPDPITGNFHDTRSSTGRLIVLRSRFEKKPVGEDRSNLPEIKEYVAPPKITATKIPITAKTVIVASTKVPSLTKAPSAVNLLGNKVKSAVQKVFKK